MKDKEQNGQDLPEGMDINTDENQSGSTHLNEPLQDSSENDDLKAELAESRDKYLRLVAEFDNFKRRNARERVDLIQTAGRDVITGMLEVLDDCDRAQKQLETSNESFTAREGVMLVFNKLRTNLQSRGLKPMQTLHEEFNPDLHEAVTEIPAPTEELKGKVVDELVKGYYLNEKIIRHAKVVVGK